MDTLIYYCFIAVCAMFTWARWLKRLVLLAEAWGSVQRGYCHTWRGRSCGTDPLRLPMFADFGPL